VKSKKLAIKQNKNSSFKASPMNFHYKINYKTLALTACVFFSGCVKKNNLSTASTKFSLPASEFNVFEQQKMNVANAQASETEVTGQSVIKRFQDVAYIHQQEAKLTDIPLPLNVEPLFCEQSFDAMLFAYACSMENNEIIAFFQREMERAGWQFHAVFRTFETMIVFTKPGKTSVISLRPAVKKAGKSELYIFIENPTFI
jgi:hypothetical protein